MPRWANRQPPARRSVACEGTARPRAGPSCSLSGQACPNAREGSFLHADRQATEKKRPQVEKNLLPPAVRLKNGEETAFSAPNKELSAKPKQQSQINCPARAKSPLTGESPIQVASEPDFPGSDFRKGQVAMARLVTSSCTGASRKLCGRSVNLQTVDLNLLVALDTMLNAKPK